MSTENEEYTLVHEDYIDEHQIDESELPKNIQNAILAIDTKIGEYENLPEGDEREEEMEDEIDVMSRKIKVDIMNYFTSQGNAPTPKKKEVEVEGQEPKAPKKREEASTGSVSGNDLLDTIFGF